MTEEFHGSLGILFAELSLPQCHSLKEKRSIIKRILHRVRNSFNVSASELDFQEKWQRCILGFAMLSNDRAHIERSLRQVEDLIRSEYPENYVRGTMNFI